MSRKPHEEAGHTPFLLLTCEHGGRDVPVAYKHLFRGEKTVLDSHRGYDVGALGVAHRMAARLARPIIFSTVTRLLIDLNRSLDHPDVFSEFSRNVTSAERDRIITTHYEPHRRTVVRVVEAAILSGHTVIHIGVHSCTDRLHDSDRDLDIALLFDETREREQWFCETWRKLLCRNNTNLRYPFNEPYRGSDDGLTTTLRQRFDARFYLGIEVEIRQGMILHEPEQHVVGDHLAAALTDCGAIERFPFFS